MDEKSKSDVLELLGELEGELEAKDIAIATLKVTDKLVKCQNSYVKRRKTATKTFSMCFLAPFLDISSQFAYLHYMKKKIINVK